MATKFYQSRPQTKPNRTHQGPRRPFGQGLAPGRQSHPTGLGVFNPDEPERRADRLTLAELQARGVEPRVEADAATHFASFAPAPARPVGNTFAKFIELAAAEVRGFPSAHSEWLAGKMLELARRARFNDAHDGPTLDEREAAWDAASADRWTIPVTSTADLFRRNGWGAGTPIRYEGEDGTDRYTVLEVLDREVRLRDAQGEVDSFATVLTGWSLDRARQAV